MSFKNLITLTVMLIGFSINISGLGTIRIVKDAQPNNAQDFDFTITNQLPGGFTLDDDSDGTLSNMRTLPSGEGTYDVTENITPGWMLSNIVCSEDGVQNTVTNFANRLASIAVENNEVVTCTFTNVPTSSITIIKDAQPDSPQDFVYSISNVSPGIFVLDDDTDPAFQNQRTFVVVPGSYQVTENVTSGWQLTNLSCISINGIDNNTINLGSRRVNINLEIGETVTCTFTNDQVGSGSITIIKDAQPDSVFDFAYTISNAIPGTFNLDDDTNGDLQNAMSFVALPAPGTYTVTETQSPSWLLLSLVCIEDGTQNSTTNIGTGTATIELEFGESVRCTYTSSNVPTAAETSIQGRIVTADGRGISRAFVTVLNATTNESYRALTNPFGYYTVGGVRAGSYCLITVSHKKHRFENRFVGVLQDLADVTFTALE
jgi:Carboxypeptidase regulatory-like domain/Prealbumin-like fold domain